MVFSKIKSGFNQMKMMQRMMKDENFRKLMDHPKMRAIMEDPEMKELLKEQKQKLYSGWNTKTKHKYTKIIKQHSHPIWAPYLYYTYIFRVPCDPIFHDPKDFIIHWNKAWFSINIGRERISFRYMSFIRDVLNFLGFSKVKRK